MGGCRAQARRLALELEKTSREVDLFQDESGESRGRLGGHILADQLRLGALELHALPADRAAPCGANVAHPVAVPPPRHTDQKGRLGRDHRDRDRVLLAAPPAAVAQHRPEREPPLPEILIARRLKTLAAAGGQAMPTSMSRRPGGWKAAFATTPGPFGPTCPFECTQLWLCRMASPVAARASGRESQSSPRRS